MARAERCRLAGRNNHYDSPFAGPAWPESFKFLATKVSIRERSRRCGDIDPVVT